MEYVALVAVVAILVVVGVPLGLSLKWKQRMARRLAEAAQPYELHRRQYERTGDVAELRAMEEAMEKGDKWSG